jgi:hypothetical protein
MREAAEDTADTAGVNGAEIFCAIPPKPAPILEEIDETTPVIGERPEAIEDPNDPDHWRTLAAMPVIVREKDPATADAWSKPLRTAPPSVPMIPENREAAAVEERNPSRKRSRPSLTGPTTACASPPREADNDDVDDAATEASRNPALNSLPSRCTVPRSPPAEACAAPWTEASADWASFKRPAAVAVVSEASAARRRAAATRSSAATTAAEPAPLRARTSAKRASATVTFPAASCSVRRALDRLLDAEATSAARRLTPSPPAPFIAAEKPLEVSCPREVPKRRPVP